MKKLLHFFCFAALLFSASFTFAQAPEGFNYQAVVRDGAGNIISNDNVTLRFTVREGNASGAMVYRETHSLTTNEFGLVTLHIGEGNANSGNFSDINWGKDKHYLQVEADPNGGSSFTNMGTTQFMSTPYAQYAKQAGPSLQGIEDYTNGLQLTLGEEHTGKIIITQHTGRPFFPENLPDGFTCTIVNFSNYEWPSNTLSSARFFTSDSGWDTANGETAFKIASGGTAIITVVTANGRKAYFVTGDVYH